MRILITGSRDWEDRDLIATAIAAEVATRQVSWGDVTVVHGGARGADQLAGQIASHWGMREERHCADWTTHGKAAGPIRNARMVALGADVCLAFPKGESRGTRGCMRLAEKAGIRVCNYGDRDE